MYGLLDLLYAQMLLLIEALKYIHAELSQLKKGETHDSYRDPPIFVAGPDASRAYILLL